MKLITCVALVVATGLLQGAAISAQASGSFRPIHGGKQIATGFVPSHHLNVGPRHREARPAFRFAGYGYVPVYRHGPVVVINNRVVIDLPRPRGVQAVTDLPVVMGIMRQPVADPVLYQVRPSRRLAE